MDITKGYGEKWKKNGFLYGAHVETFNLVEESVIKKVFKFLFS